MRHGSFNVVPASIGLKTTDRAHLKVANLKRRRKSSPSASLMRHFLRPCFGWKASLQPFPAFLHATGIALHWQTSFLCSFVRHIWFSRLPDRSWCGFVATPCAAPVSQLSSMPLGLVSLPLRHEQLLSFSCCRRLLRDRRAMRGFRHPVVVHACGAVYQPLRHARLLSISFFFHAGSLDLDEPTVWFRKAASNQVRRLGHHSQQLHDRGDRGDKISPNQRPGLLSTLKTCAAFVERCTQRVPQ